MVTKVSDTVVDTQCERQYKYLPGESSGLDFVVQGGQFPEKEVLVIDAKTTFVLTDDATNYIVIDLDVNPGVTKAVTVLPSLGFLLFTVVTVSGEVTSVKDWRWRSVKNRITGQSFNQFEATLDSEHYWRLDEASGTFADSGTGTAITMTETSVGIGRLMPGAVRGFPESPAGQRTADGGYIQGNSLNRHTEGTLGAWVKMSSTEGDFSGASGVGAIIGQRWQGNDGLFWSLYVNSDGSVECRCVFGANSNESVTAAGAVVNAEWNFITATQPDDGTGIHIHINGVDTSVTATATGSFDLDSWYNDVDDLASTGNALQIFNKGGPTGNWPGNNHITIQFPFIKTGSAYSTSQILELFEAGNTDIEFPVGWYEAVLDLADPEVHVPGQDTGNNSRLPDIGSQPTNWVPNQITHGVGGSLIGTDYFDLAYGYGTNASVASSTVANWPANFETASTGSFGAIIRPNSITARHHYTSMGATGARFLHIGTDGDQFIFEIELVGTGLYSQATTGHTITPDTYYFVVWVQDGTFLKCYIDGVLFDGGDITETETGTGVDETSWINTVNDDGAMTSWSLGGNANSASVNTWNNSRLHNFFWTTTILSQSDITTMFSGAQGGL